MRIIESTVTRDAKGRFIRSKFADFSAEIERGVQWLNRMSPGWFNSINLDHLHLMSGTACVLGQLAMTDFRQQVDGHLKSVRGRGGTRQHDYWTVLAAFGIATQSTDMGFDMDTSAIEAQSGIGSHNLWEDLTFQWVERIQKLRADAGTLTV